MGFRQGTYAKVWEVEDKGNYSIANVSVSKKNSETGEYETEFQDGYVRLVGNAHKVAQEKCWATGISERGETIKISSCDVTNKYDSKTKKLYTNFVIFGFELPNEESSAESEEKSTKSTKKTTKKSTAKKTSKKSKTDFEDVVDDDDDLPF